MSFSEGLGIALFVVSVGSLGLAQSGVDPGIVERGGPTKPYEPEPEKPIKVKQGETKSNGDVSVENLSTGTKKPIKIDPGPEDPDETKTSGKADTTVTTNNGSHTSIHGIDSGDVVNIRSNNVSTITGTGGEVTIGNDSYVTVTNEAVKPPNGTGPVIQVTYGGVKISVYPGSTTTFEPAG